jgi:diacylglycerol kinase
MSKRSYNYNDIDCNIEILNTIKAELTDKLQTVTSSTKDIDEIKTSLKNTNAALKGLTDGFASNFLSQYHSLASSGISAFIAAISGTIAIIALASALLKDFIKEHINSHTKEIIDTASKHLIQEANIAHNSLAAQIYARIGGNILYSQLKSFYNDSQCPQNNRRDRYLGYLEGGTHISTIGNDTANDLVTLYNKADLTDNDYYWLNACRNNFIFYVCSENDVYFNTPRTEETLKKLGDVASAISELEKMLSDGRKKDHLRENKETLIWAKLCLGTISCRDAKTQIEALAREADTPVKWKRDIQARYNFYDRFPEHPQLTGMRTQRRP